MPGGLLIKEARLRAGLTQAQLAGRLGTSQPVVARWETGSAEPGFQTVVRAIRACGLDLLVELVPYDDADLLHISRRLRLSPAQRLEQLQNMLEVERWAHRARPVGSGG